MIINPCPKVAIMSIHLPGAVSIFFDVSNGGDSSGLRHILAADAVAHDEGRSHEGCQAVQAWLQEARRKYQYHVAPMAVQSQDERVTVATKVSGNFPGSPLQLEYVFRMAGDLIQSVEIR
ncbi:nuclear transport factor 2 family protein [Magnetospirillum sulfuroxidans]|uniref:Nuclear transport factor 2 family protein n=1 Tax=Magnetospirillum sulfuroxidans TaxID=611300 RepID=A0ABS5IA36_9PROT|nr:nuclear transport factor 2 family protein [Magnetospirillum sulfuroxidans]MBR9971022.1 nuclear transport factor 2 family protein [Magnetospirillum sulfuroxidans]